MLLKFGVRFYSYFLFHIDNSVCDSKSHNFRSTKVSELIASGYNVHVFHEDNTYTFSLLENNVLIGGGMVHVGDCYIKGIGLGLDNRYGAYIFHVHIDSRYRRRGLCSKLLHFILLYMFEKNPSLCSLAVSTKNLPMINLMQSMGFTKSKKITTFGLLKFKLIRMVDYFSSVNKIEYRFASDRVNVFII